MFNTGLIKFKKFLDKYGQLVSIEGIKDIPFSIKRVYYISQVGEGIERGYHAHRTLHQILVCVNGSVKIRLKNGKEQEEVVLSDPTVGLYIGPFIWREMCEFSEGAVLLVLASDHYNEDDYIRNFDFYLQEVEERF